MTPGGTDGADVLYGDARRGDPGQDTNELDELALSWQRIDPEAKDYTADCPARSGDYRYGYLLWEKCEPEEQDEYGYPIYQGPGTLIGSFTDAAGAEAARAQREQAVADRTDDPDLDYRWDMELHATYAEGKVPQERELYVFTYGQLFAELGYGCQRTLEHDLSDQQLLGCQIKIDLTTGREQIIVSSTDHDLAAKKLQQLMKEHGLELDAEGVLRPSRADVFDPTAT